VSHLSEEQRLMRQSCRDFVDTIVIPFIRKDWQREWLMTPEDRLPPEILQGAEKVGIRTLGVPEEFGGIELDPNSEVQTFAPIAEEIARGDSGLADKLVQNWKVSVLLRNLAPRHLQEKWFKRLLADPQFLLAHCLTEPRGASDRWLPYNVPEAAMQTRAVRKNGEWIINGRKHRAQVMTMVSIVPFSSGICSAEPSMNSTVLDFGRLARRAMARSFGDGSSPSTCSARRE
jgi:alkylation response protein AidB-like acyl-CoA dehydrogenase